MHARSAVIEVSTDRIDAVSRAMQEELIPRYQEADGYEGFVLVANRESGKVLGISFWETKSDLEAADALGAEARQRLADAGGGAQPGAREVWEVLVDDEP
jgi:heme-degrading monooxygenase HmoA